MRLDKYLKVSRLIKRRTVANEACEKQKVLVNGKIVKPSYEVKIGDIIELQLGVNSLKVEVTDIMQHVKKENAKEMYEIR